MTDEELAAKIAGLCDGDPERQLAALRKVAVMRFLAGKLPDEDIAEVVQIMAMGEVVYPPDGGEGEPETEEPEAPAALDVPHLRLVA